MPSALLVPLLCLALAEPPRELVLPPGFHLDPVQGLVASRPLEAWGEGWIGWLEGELIGGAALEVLPQGGPGEPPPAVRRPVAATSPVRVRPGVELVWSVPARDDEPARWGWLAVRAERAEGLVLELVRAAVSQDELPRLPRALEVRASDAGPELHWPADEDRNVTWSVSRRALEGSGSQGAGEPLASPAKTGLVDAAAPAERVLEYTVERADPPSIGPRVRAVREAWAPDLAVEVVRGQRISLLTGRIDGERGDLKVEFSSPDGLQVSPGPGVGLRVLSPAEDERWSLEPAEGGAYLEQRTYVQAGRTLAVVLPEGLFARVDVRRGENGPRLSCQLDLDGTRLFPRPPVLSGAARVESGILLTLGPGPRTVPPELEGGFDLVLEREDDYRSQEWSEVLRVAPGTRPLVDPAGGPARLVRYRGRYVLADGRSSPPGEPIEALVGLGPGEIAARAMVDAAIAELAAPDWVRREHARATLEHLGPLAVDGLRSALASEDPEVVGAAQHVLSMLETEGRIALGATAVGSAPIVLAARAEALGLGEPPRADLLDESPLARVVAVLSLDPARERDEAWRALCGETDPDVLVQEAAALRGAIAPWNEALAGTGSWTDMRLDAAPPLSLERALELVASVRTRGEALRVLQLTLGSQDPRRELALLATIEGLRARRAREGEIGDLGEARLALELLARAARRDEPLLVDAATHLAEDPTVRLLATRALCERALARATRALPSERLPEASAESLAARLEELAAAGASDLELVLPTGRYSRGPAGAQLRLSIPGLRLVGEDATVLTGMCVVDARDVVLSGLTLDGENRNALAVNGGSAALLDCRIEAGGSCILAQDASVVLWRTRLAASGPSGATTGVRMNGRCILLARETCFGSRGPAALGHGLVFLERVAIDAEKGPGVDLQREGELYLLDSVITCESNCLSAIPKGLIEGAALRAKSSPMTTGLEPGLAVCLEHLSFGGENGAAGPSRLLERCPLGR